MDAGGGGEFGRLMQQAAAIKGEQAKAERRRFEAQPSFLQNTLFHCLDAAMEAIRADACLETRLASARGLKEAGNARFREGDVRGASDKYERCLGCFWWMASSEKDFRNKGIKDEFISFHDHALHDAAVRGLLSSTLTNVAACQMRLQEWATCIQACDKAVELDPSNVKALYRRAQARTVPVSSGAAELDLAIVDLRLALDVKPDEKAVQALLAELQRTRKKQRVADKETFSGMFQRPNAELVPDSELRRAKDKENAGASANQEREAKKEVRFYKDLAAQYRRQGKTEDADEIERVVHKTEQSAQPRSFASPTPKMVQEAKDQYGLDLTDPAVQQELQRMSELKERGMDIDVGTEAGFEATQKPGTEAPPNMGSSTSSSSASASTVVGIVVAVAVAAIAFENLPFQSFFGQ